MEALRSSWIHTLKLQVTDFFFHEGLDAKYGNACMLSCFSYVQLFATLWTIARQAPLSLGFSTQEYWTGLPCPPPGDLPNPGIEPRSPALLADSLLPEAPGDFLGKNSGVSCRALLQGIFPTQGSNPLLLWLLHCLQTLYH